MIFLTVPADGACVCSCGSKLTPGETLTLTFIYTNTNSVQDDAFEYFLQNNQQTWVSVGTIDGACISHPTGVYVGSGTLTANHPCACSSIDVKNFSTDVDSSFISVCEGRCLIRYRTDMLRDNGCGTYGTLDIAGPRGVSIAAAGLGGSGTIDITNIL